MTKPHWTAFMPYILWTCQTSKIAVRCVKCARCMCVHMVFLLAYKMCKGGKVPGSLQLHIWRSAVRRRCFRHMDWTVMGNVAHTTRRTVCLSILSCLGFVIPCPGFGSFMCPWSLYVFIHQLNQTRSLKRVQMQHSHLFKWTTLTDQMHQNLF